MHDRIVDLYERRTDGWIEDRGERVEASESAMLNRLTAGLPLGATILDVGCGHGRPIGAELLRRGFQVTGLDSSPTLIEHARLLNGGEWIAGDMRQLELDRRFHAVLAWYSLFHLAPDDQRAVLPRLIAHLGRDGRIVFASGPTAGVAIREWRGEPLYHASLSPRDYREILEATGHCWRSGESVCSGRR